jgi:hypothetical protein
MGGERQDPLHNAAREARKAASRARDFADLFEQYADRLLTPGCEMDAAGLRMHAKDKLAALREALSDSDDWARMAEWHADTTLVTAGS